jgi:hypothetical protein
MGNRSSRLKGNNGTNASTAIPPRFASCGILYDAGIPSCIWLEDALEQLGAPTLVFDLFLLVPDVEASARVLRNHGYRKAELSLALKYVVQCDNRFTPPPNESPTSSSDAVVLLSADCWFYRLPAKSEDLSTWFPSLPELLVALIAKWLSFGG